MRAWSSWGGGTPATTKPNPILSPAWASTSPPAIIQSHVIGELEFLNALYPWFEPRTAPMHPEDIGRLLAQKPVQEKMAALKVEYMIWLDGSTVRSGGSGSMACSLGGCFGFGTWSQDSNYEATIWDFTDRAEVGQVNTSATGQSYMPAVIVPIPIIAPVQGTACDGIGEQLLAFLSSKY